MLQKLSVVFLLCALFSLSAHADDVFIRNRAFKGQVEQSGGQTWLELKPLAKALKWTLVGDEQKGFALSEDGSATPPGSGKVSVNGQEVTTRNGTSFVALEEIAPLIGAKVVTNKELGTIDVNLVKPKGQSGTGNAIGSFPYTLLEFSAPREELCKYIQPAIKKAKKRYSKRMQHVLVNVDHGGTFASYKKYKKVKDRSFPEVVLVNANGDILFQLRGNHVIDRGLADALKKNIKKKR